jgi:adenylate cyclase
MPIEIERKFLVRSEAWRTQAERAERLVQGYLANTPFSSIRVRMAGEQAWLNIKQAVSGVRRAEYDYRIPVSDAQELLTLREGHLIEKTRYHVRCVGQLWEVDVFWGDNEGLTTGEIELQSIDQPFERPAWLGAEISDDARYYNNMLSLHPYKSWM